MKGLRTNEKRCIVRQVNALSAAPEMRKRDFSEVELTLHRRCRTAIGDCVTVGKDPEFYSADATWLSLLLRTAIISTTSTLTGKEQHTHACIGHLCQIMQARRLVLHDWPLPNFQINQRSADDSNSPRSFAPISSATIQMAPRPSNTSTNSPRNDSSANGTASLNASKTRTCKSRTRSISAIAQMESPSSWSRTEAA